MSNIIDEIDKASMRDDIPEFRPGDSVKVHVKVVEGSRTPCAGLFRDRHLAYRWWRPGVLYRPQAELRDRC